MIKACPDDCTFDWSQFHKDLDTALAHFIDEDGGDLLTSNVFDFVKFSNTKRILSEKESPNE